MVRVGRKRPRGGAVGSAADPVATGNWASRLRLVTCVQEDHASPLYCLSFCEVARGFENHFASCGKNRASVYALEAREIKPLQVYVDEDDAEDFYCCAWSVDAGKGHLLLCLGGASGIIKILDLHADPSQAVLAATLFGHGNQVLTLAVHPHDTDLLLSGSKDESVRLWNISTRCLVAVFAGDGGHREQVLSVNWHLGGHCFVSAGMDQLVKVWNVNSASVRGAIEDAKTFCPRERRQQFPTVFEQFPSFSTRHAHNNYVDCARFVGDLLLSKSTENTVVLWTPQPTAQRPDGVAVLREFTFPQAEIWFVRFGVDDANGRVAVGNRMGGVYLFDLFCLDGLVDKRGQGLPRPGSEEAAAAEDGGADAAGRAAEGQGAAEAGARAPAAEEGRRGSASTEEYRYRLAPLGKVFRLGKKQTVRHCVFSPSGASLLFCCEDGTIWWYRDSDSAKSA